MGDLGTMCLWTSIGLKLLTLRSCALVYGIVACNLRILGRYLLSIAVVVFLSGFGPMPGRISR